MAAPSCDPKFYRPEEDFVEPLKKYVQMNYHLVKRFDSTNSDEIEEIWQRNEKGNTAFNQLDR